jgi:hypothetical protein
MKNPPAAVSSHAISAAMFMMNLLAMWWETAGQRKPSAWVDSSATRTPYR